MKTSLGDKQMEALEADVSAKIVVVRKDDSASTAAGKKLPTIKGLYGLLLLLLEQSQENYEAVHGPQKRKPPQYDIAFNVTGTHVGMHADNPLADGPGHMILNDTFIGEGWVNYVAELVDHADKTPRGKEMGRMVGHYAGEGTYYGFTNCVRYVHTHGVFRLLKTPAKLDMTSKKPGPSVRITATTRTGEAPRNWVSEYESAFYKKEEPAEEVEEETSPLRSLEGPAIWPNSTAHMDACTVESLACREGFLNAPRKFKMYVPDSGKEYAFYLLRVGFQSSQSKTSKRVRRHVAQLSSSSCINFS